MGISVSETRFDRRGFRGGDARARARLESVGAAFLYGYHAALAEDRPARLAQVLEAFDTERRGFACEGAAMALALLDRLTPWRRHRWSAFLDGPGDPHAYMVHVGAGWAHARLGGEPDRILEGHDPLLGWLILDGWGFHDAYFDWPRVIARRDVHRRFRGYARRAYDQGLGRALWFVDGADPVRIAATVGTFADGRHGDLWSGIGLAAAYAGGAPDAALAVLPECAGAHRGDLAQGAAFAAEARRRAGNPAPHTERACLALCGTGADEAAAVTTEMLPDTRPDGGLPAYEAWRQRVRERLERRAVAV